jgi:hypothetical protein
MKKSVLSAFLGALLSVAVFGLAYLTLDQTLIDKFLPRSKTEGMIFFPMVIIAPVAAIFFHEFGHLVAGLSFGQRFKLFVVAFIGVAEEDGKIKFFLNKNLGYFGGIVATVPKSIDAIDHKVFGKILIAGPIASLLYGLLCLIIFVEFDTWFNSFFGLTSLTSLGLFLATTIPGKSGMMYTDRKRYQRLRKKGVTQDAEIALYQLISQSLIENSFKNVDISKTHELEKDDEVEMKFWAEYIRYCYFKENEFEKEKELSKSKLHPFRSTIGKNLWKTLKIE